MSQSIGPVHGPRFHPASLGGVNAQDAGKKVISTSNAPEVIGPYSQAIRVGNTVYLAGQIAIDPKTKQVMANASIEDQTRLVLEYIRAWSWPMVRPCAPHRHDDGFPQGLNQFGKMNEVYATFFKSGPPAANCRGCPPTA